MYDLSQPALRTLAALVSQQGTPGDVPAESWLDLIALAHDHGLAPMLYWAVRQAGVNTSADAAWAPLAQAARRAAAMHVLLENAQGEVQAALSTAGIPAVWLKGIVLAATVYPRPSLRPMADLDVLVPYAQREDARRVLQAAGYDFFTGPGFLFASDDALNLKLTHHYFLRGGVSNSVFVELHFRLLRDPSLLSEAGTAWFWSQVQTIPVGGAEIPALKPEVHLLYLCAHAVLQDGETQTRLVHFLDLHRLITTTTLDWNLIAEQAGALGWAEAVERAFTRTTALFRTSIPGKVLARLRSEPLLAGAAQRVVGLQGRGAKWERMAAALAGLSATDKARLVREVMFPTRAYMRRHYAVPAGQAVWPCYLRRWFDQGQEVLAWTWKRRRGRHRG